jgi:hypothetical protein
MDVPLALAAAPAVAQPAAVGGSHAGGAAEARVVVVVGRESRRHRRVPATARAPSLGGGAGVLHLLRF